MKKLCLLIVCFIIFYPSWSNASKNIDGAKIFINEFLEAELNGKQDFRVENTIYSKKRELIIKRDYKPMIGEIFYWDFAKLCVVDGYEVTNIKIISLKATVDVTFQEYACTGSAGYGDIPLVKTNRKSQERYILEYKKSRWWIKDPPIPRISKKALIEYNNGIIKDMSKWIFEKGVEKQKEYYHNLINTNDMLKGN